MHLFPGLRPGNLAARLGLRDFGINRARIESLRARLVVRR